MTATMTASIGADMTHWTTNETHIMPAVSSDTPYMRAVVAEVLAEAGRVVDQPLTEDQAHQRLLIAAARTLHKGDGPKVLPERLRTFIDGVHVGLKIGFFAGKRESG